jgi:prophage antirepressor-like protein
MGNIRTSLQHFDETEKVVHSMDTLGGSQQVSFLTEKGLYKILFKSRKPIAEKFQNWICEVVKEIRLNGMFDLQKQLEEQKTEFQKLEDQQKQEYEIQLAKQKILEREKILLKEFSTIGAIFYIIKVKSLENGHYIIKIGESRIGIKNRYNEHKSNYDECLLLDCFLVSNSKDFETFIKSHELIRANRVNNLPNHESELELFLIGKNLSYQTLVNIVNNNIKYFNYNDTTKLELEIQKLKMMLDMTHTKNENLLVQKLVENVEHLSSKIDTLEKYNKEILEKMNSLQTKTTTNFNEPLPTLGPRLQKINPETSILVKVYESIAECIKESNFKLKRPTIVKAINENTIYYGYRWKYVDRNIDPNIITNLEITKPTKIQNVGYIAKLNKEKTEIVNVYLDKKTACHCNGYKSASALDSPVKLCSLTNGNYYILYDNCREELKNNFIEKNNNKAPFLYKNGVGQYDMDNNLIHEFFCKYDCIKQLKISDKTLAKALDNDIMYNNTYFKSINNKLKCF